MNKSIVGCVVLLAGCASSSAVMESEGGTYLVSAGAAAARGGTVGANDLAYAEAQKYCAAKDRRAIVVDAQERDVYQSTAGAAWTPSGGSAGAGRAASGRVNLRFRCE